MATDSSHRVIMGKNLVHILASSFLIGSSLFSQVTRTTIISQTSAKFGHIGPRTAELAALDRLEKIPKKYNGEDIVNTLAPSFSIGSSSFLQVIRTTIRVRKGSNSAKYDDGLRR